jgi:hypothetical protein
MQQYLGRDGGICSMPNQATAAPNVRLSFSLNEKLTWPSHFFDAILTDARFRAWKAISGKGGPANLRFMPALHERAASRNIRGRILLHPPSCRNQPLIIIWWTNNLDSQR